MSQINIDPQAIAKARARKPIIAKIKHDDFVQANINVLHELTDLLLESFIGWIHHFGTSFFNFVLQN